jgi:hypothetical protein
MPCGGSFLEMRVWLHLESIIRAFLGTFGGVIHFLGPHSSIS